MNRVLPYLGLGAKSFLTFSFNSFSILSLNSEAIPTTSHKSLNLNQDYHLKNVFLVSFL